ncbi:hypothetical protein CSHISOI_00366 [Colletotrichum shisoi]|uniref:Uncharacterized protein n=1 Tax=Colletotrichum shisoi TaxID=2078593 RepID=A0A5Q4C9E8_9PEZI|nr:hypothetical protein CSHISOI_00366 [Colletotrichum shisoi]
MRPTTPTPVSNWSKSPAPFDADVDRNGCTSPVGLRFACGSKRLEAVGKLRRVSKDERRSAPPQARYMALKKPAWLLCPRPSREALTKERQGFRQPGKRAEISKRQLLPAGSRCRRPGLDAGRSPRKLAYRYGYGYLAAPHLTERRDEILSTTKCICGSIAFPLPVLPKRLGSSARS